MRTQALWRMAIRHKAWDIIVIGLIFCVFDLWGTLRLTGVLV